MQSFNLFIVFAVLLINTQVYAFTCPKANRSNAYCVRKFTPEEAKQSENQGKTMFKVLLKPTDNYTCEGVKLKDIAADSAFCCQDVPGQVVGQVLNSPQSMWDNKCSKVNGLK